KCNDTVKEFVCEYCFFQAEDGIRDRNVTGVQTCALPICPYFETELENVDDYLFSVVTSVIQKETDHGLKHLIQYEDKEIGWISLEDSIPVYRFKPMHFQVIEEDFQTNELNQKMNIDKDFISHFKGKLLTVKSEVCYKDETYYSVFLKNKFHGFHHESHLDPLFDIHLQ